MISPEILTKEIATNLNRLKVSTNQNPYSGLSVEYSSDISYDRLDVEIFDDYNSAIYDGVSVLCLLRALNYATLDDRTNHECPNIWEAIQAAFKRN
jgi:hypothetical protein